MRALKIAGAAAAVLIAIVIMLLVTGVPSGVITSMVQDRIERDTGYRIAIAGRTEIDVWPTLSLALHNVTLDHPKNSATDAQLRVGEVRANISFASLLSGAVKVSELAIDHPILRLPMQRERTLDRNRPHAGSTGTDDPANAAFPVERVTISNGTIVFFDPQTASENRVEDFNANVAIGADRKFSISGDARPGDRPLTFTIKATPPAGPLNGRTTPVELTLDVPGLLTRELTSKAEVRINGRVLLINDLSGLLGDGKFNGWASVDFAGKPVVKVDLDFQRLGLSSSSDKSPPVAAPHSAPQPWSDAPIDLSGLNYVDAAIRISAAELKIGQARFAPALIEATLAGGVVKATFSRLGAYDGQVNGVLSIDASTTIPSYTLQTDATAVRALPLLSGLADFDNLDGKMQAKADVKAAGDSLRAIMSNLSGTASVEVRDGAIRNLNVAKMIRALTSGTLSGWQERPDQTTDLSQLSATAVIAKGQAAINDLFLAGPLVRMTGAGTIDLASRTLAFRIEPKLVMTTEGQGGSADPVGLGIPVIVQGTWSEPRIYPDVAGILDNPDTAYAKLRQMGQGLFGKSATGTAGSGDLGATLGTMIQQGLGASPSRDGVSPGGQPSQPQSSQPQSSPLDDIMKRLFGR